MINKFYGVCFFNGEYDEHNDKPFFYFDNEEQAINCCEFFHMSTDKKYNDHAVYYKEFEFDKDDWREKIEFWENKQQNQNNIKQED